MKRFLALLLTLSMLLTMVPLPAFAQDEEEPETIAVETEQPEETAETEPEETAAEETEPEETVPEETEDTVPEETEPEETIPGEIVPEETVPVETEPEETEPDEELPETAADAPDEEEDGEWEIIGWFEDTEEIITDEDFSSEDMLTRYLLSRETARPDNSYGAKNLTGLSLKMYQKGIQMVQGVKDGTRTNTIVDMPVSETGYQDTIWTAKDLGISSIYDADKKVTNEAREAIAKKIGYNGSDVFNALYVDVGPDLFWRGRYVGTYPAFTAYYVTEKNGQPGYKPAGSLRIAYSVSDTYKKPSSEKYSYEVDQAKLQTVNTAKNNARSYVNNAAGYSDYDKMKYYRDVICDLTYHMGDAADELKDRNDYSPWGFVNVFDGDPDTNVVCGGYAVAFQYICEMTRFDDGSIRVYSILGDVIPGGYHMWNNVRMPDGKVYVVDVTWCDGGDYAKRDNWFMAAIVDGTYDTSYFYQSSRSERSYADHMYRIYTKEELTISDTEYVSPLTALHSGTAGAAAWSMDINGCLTVNGQLPQFTNAADVPWNPWARSIRRAVITGTTSIPDYAFSGCRALQEVELPQGLQSIGQYAFDGCRSLKEVNIPDSVTSLGQYVFQNCLRLQSVHLPAALKTLEFGDFWFCGSLTDVEIPASVTYVSNSFWQCVQLKSLVFAGKAPGFASNAFQGNAITIYYPDCDSTWNAVVGQDYLGTITWKPLKSWTNCGDTMTWSLKNGVLTISGTGRMYSFDSTETPWAVSRVRELRVEEGVESLGIAALRGAAQLTKISLPSSLYMLGAEAFYGCTALAEITLPGTVTWIGSRTFGDCTGLKKVTFEGAAPILNGVAFQGITATVYYHGDQYEWSAVADQNYGGTLTWVNLDYRPDYDVVFDANGGTGAPEAQKKLRDQALTLSSKKPTRRGYTFSGWALTPEGDAVYQPGDTYNKNKDLELYAVWKLEQYRITYVLNGGVQNSANPTAYTVQSSALQLYAPERPGYAFTGWYLESGLRNAVSEIAPGSVGSLTLHAGWREYAYSVRFDGNGADSGTMPALADRKFTDVFTLPANTFRRTGFVFAGWNTAADGSGVPYVNKEKVGSLGSVDGQTVTLYAQWQGNSYTVTFKGNGGNYLPEGTTKTATSYTQPGAYGTSMELEAVRFIRKGYTFLGWNTKSNGKGSWYPDCAEVINLTAKAKGKVTLYAQWEANPYTVRFDLNGVEGEMPVLSLRYAKSMALPKLTVRKFGHRFTGWYCGETGKVYKDKASVKNLTALRDDDVTLYALWEENTYTVKFSLNGGKPAGAVFDKQTGRNNSDMALRIPTGIPVRENYTFCGWSLKSDGSGELLQPGTSVYLDASKNNQTITLYAVWQYSVTMIDLGSGSQLVQAEHFFNEYFYAENPGFSRFGYNLAGWNTNREKAMSGTVQYKVGAKLRNLKPDTVLYAVWKPAR